MTERLEGGNHLPRSSTWRAVPASARSASGRRSGATTRSTRSAGWSPSNAICRTSGFELLEACEFEFPNRHFMTCNDRRRACAPSLA